MLYNPGLCRTWSGTLKTGFLTTWLISEHVTEFVIRSFFSVNDSKAVHGLCKGYKVVRGSRWLNGRASDSGAKGPGFKNPRLPYIVLEQDTCRFPKYC